MPASDTQDGGGHEKGRCVRTRLHRQQVSAGDVVTFDQNPEVQEQPVRELVVHRGWTLHRVYSDRASGAKETRPALDELMRDARRGEFDVVVVWRFDRFARSAKQLVLALEEFRTLGIDFVSHQGALDTSTPIGQAMFTIIAAMAQLERSLVGERSRAGIVYAKIHGTKSGRPIGRPRAVFDRRRVVELRAQGRSWGQIALILHTSVASVRRAWQAAVQQEAIPTLRLLSEAMPKSP